jgi:2-polyprenyl-3-methyl-5-hydroxy-6-metoxy-1,4-benzoquinol methylase
MTERGYQTGFSHDNVRMYAVADRRRKAETMIAVLRDHFGPALAEQRLLNVGCSTGIIDRVLAEAVAGTVGIDIDAEAIAYANAQPGDGRSRFAVMDAMRMDFADAAFDIAICSQVYEHMPDARRMMQEVFRVLRPGGVCYFAATNRLCLIEQHYRLPFLSIIPVPLAHWYLRLLRRGRHYYERHLTVWGLRRLTQCFERIDYTARLVREPERFGTAYMVGTRNLKNMIVRAVLRGAYWAFPGYVWLLRKPAAPAATP